MSDDLRMRAVVEDGFTGPLASLRAQLRGVGGNSTAKSVAKDWKQVGDNVAGVANSLRFGVAGGLRAVGMGSLAAGVGIASVAAAVGGTVSGLRKLSGETRGLRMMSADLGLGVEQLRKMKIFTDHFGMSWDTATGSIKTFSGNLFELQRHYGAAFNELRGMNLAGLAEDLAKAPNMEAALNTALEGIKNIKNPVLQRRVAEILLGTDQWAVIARESYSKVQQEIAAMLKTLPAGSVEAADKFAEDMTRIGTRMENLRTQFLAPLLPPFERFVQLLAGSKQGEGVVGKSGSLLGRLLSSVVDGLEWLTEPSGKSPTGSAAREGLAKQLQDNERKLGIVTDKIEQMTKSGGSPALPLQQEQEKLRGEVEKLRKAIEQANQDALLQKSSFGGNGLGGGGVIQAAYHPGGGGGGTRFGSARYPNLGATGGAEDPEAARRGGAEGETPRSGGRGTRFGRARYPNLGVTGGGAEDPEAARRGGAEGETLRSGGRGNYANDNAGAGLGGSEFLRARRERFARELEAKPGLKKRLAAVLDLENPGAGPAVVESLMNRMDYTGGSIEKGLGINNRARSFYGPVRRGLDLSRERELDRNPHKLARLMRSIDQALAGSNVVQGYTDQGSAGDPNYHAGGVGVNINRERFNNWGGGPGGREGARQYREWVMRNVAAESRRPAAALAPAENSVGLLAQARRADAAVMRHTVDGNASLKIDLNGLPQGSKVLSSFDGMFRQVRINRGRPMQSVWEGNTP